MRRRPILVAILVLAALAVVIGYCRAPRVQRLLSGGTDEISLSNVSGGHLATVLLDGRRAACVDDELLRTSNIADVGNVLSPATCIARTAVLAQQRAMHFAENVTVWTDSTGDVENVALASMPVMPMSIWVPSGGVSDAKFHVSTAAQTYSDMQCGIGFDESLPVVEDASLASMSASCENLDPVREIGYTRGRLNVYYVFEISDAQDSRGIHCVDTDPNVILISTEWRTPATLSHEVGHALTLLHTNEIDGLNTYVELNGTDVSNVMLQGGLNQWLLSTGQCFRCNLNSESAINRLGARTGPKPGCDAAATPAGRCPELAFDVVPK
jgi:hypothetical protein